MTKWDGSHKRVRRQLLPGAYGRLCHFCGQVMLPGQLLDLDHHEDGHPEHYRGMSHASCNRADGARRKRNNQRRVIAMASAYGVEISTDRAHTSVVAAAHRGDLAVVELVAYLDGSDTADQVARIVAARARVVVDPRSPAATLMEPLRGLRVEVTEPSTSDVAVGHGLFLDELRAGRLRFVAHPALDAAAQHAEARHLAGGEALERRRPTVDTGPLVAAELALWALLRVPVPRPPTIHLFVVPDETPEVAK